jgi:hypothetical protein
MWSTSSSAVPHSGRTTQPAFPAGSRDFRHASLTLLGGLTTIVELVAEVPPGAEREEQEQGR